ncbi:MAG: GTP cyclohydrolase II [Burkholderiales bacterium]|nr:GTP cyclohydrolase II [Burkholderiales bacterium]
MTRATPIDDALATIRRGRFAVVVDNTTTEGRGWIMVAAEHANPAETAFMVRHSDGLVRAVISDVQFDALRLTPHPQLDARAAAAPWQASADFRGGRSSSTVDRSRTLRALADPAARAEDFSSPGHVFVVRCAEGGVLAHSAGAEAAFDLVRLAGLRRCAAFAELCDIDGVPLRNEGLCAFAQEHGLPLVTTTGLAEYRWRVERLVERLSAARLPTKHGDFTIRSYRIVADPLEQVALVHEGWTPDAPVLVRVHSECLTGDIFGSSRCDCGEQLELALDRIAVEGGVVVYLRGHEGRGIGLSSKLSAYVLQDKGYDTVEANERLGLPVDARSYAAAAQILRDLGCTRIRLLTNNPAKVAALTALGITVDERVPVIGRTTVDNAHYLATKRYKLGHALEAIESPTRTE